MTLHESFVDPPSSYRTAPFWSLNGELEDDELRRQIRAFHEVGMGGFFMHSRTGLRTPYMGLEWRDRIATCIEAARRLDMKAWLYDEDRYPSGSCGGMVTRQHPELRQRALWFPTGDRFDPARANRVLGVFRLRREGQRIIAYAQVEEADGDCLVFAEVTAGESTWFNDSAYVDLLNPEAARRFLELTHDRYAAWFGHDFGNLIPGIFTDEPHVQPLNCPSPSLPWTPKLPDLFREAFGYDLLSRLPELVHDLPGSRKLRFDYWTLVTRLFADNCNRVWGEWCASHGIALTGHMWEHAFPDPRHQGSLMPQYYHYQMPGIDMLFNTYERDTKGEATLLSQFGNIAIVKEVASVAHQFGRRRVLSETYGGSGWELSFADQKRIGDWQYALGINFVCQHLAHYTLQGRRKRDWPLSFLPHQPWWDLYRILGDYHARLSFILSQGRHVTDLLVLHPWCSAWCDFVPGEERQADGVAQAWGQLNKDLCELHRDFDHGDDLLMEDHATVDGAALRLGECVYHTVIIPVMDTLRGSTFELLQRFVANGGRVVALQPGPTEVDGEPSDVLARFITSEAVALVSAEREALDAALGPRPVSVTDVRGREIGAIYCHQRVIDDRRVLFFCNVDDQRGYDAAISLPCTGRVEEWDPVTGRRCPVAATVDGKRLLLRTRFHPVGSRLFVVDTSQDPVDGNALPGFVESTTEVEFTSVTRRHDNLLLLDFCRYRVNGGDWSERKYCDQAYQEIRERTGLGPDGGFRCVQPWVTRDQVAPAPGEPRLDVRFSFRMDGQVPGRLCLACETPESFAVNVNGIPVEFPRPRDGADYHLDPAFVVADIRGAVHPGDNEVVLTADPVMSDIELEACFLCGDFGVRQEGNRFAIVDEQPPGLGDWVPQGYPFYAGAFAYHAQLLVPPAPDGSRVALRAGEFDGVVARALVDGQPVATLAWPPYEADLTPFTGRTVTLTIEVYSSLRNLLGPLHFNQPVRGFAPPHAFDYSDWGFTEDYDFVPVGLIGPVHLTVRTPA